MGRMAGNDCRFHRDVQLAARPVTPMRFRLRTLLIALALAPPVLAGFLILPHYFSPGASAGLLMLAMALTGAVAGFTSMARNHETNK